MKKLGMLFIFLLLITGCSFYSNQKSNSASNSTSNEEEKEIINSSILYYKKENLNRYIEYKNNHPELSDEDVITQVNIGLDHEYYTETIETPYLNSIKILSNKYYYMPSDYVPENLEKISAACCSGTRYMVKEAKEAFEKLCTDAKSQGYTVRAMSTYRSYNYQVTLYQNYVLKDGKEAADTYSARPGFSEHQTGLVADVDDANYSFTSFHKSKSFKWMRDNAYKYGFIMRYPEDKVDITGYSYESWHYRYVGVEAATKMREENLTFDEYYFRYLDK